MLTIEERTRIVQRARQLIGTPHDRMDCSHFVCAAVQAARPNFGYHTSIEYARLAPAVEAKDALPADLVFFPESDNTGVKHGPHIALVLRDGNCWFIGSESTNGVHIVNRDNVYWRQRPCSYHRLG